MKRIIALMGLVIAQLAVAQSGTFFYEMQKRPHPQKDTTSIKKEFVLDVKDGKSVFRTPRRKKGDSLLHNGKLGYGVNNDLEEQIYVVKEGKRIYKSIKVPVGLDYTYYDVTLDEPLNWKILPEVSKIGDLKVQKAEVNYGERQWTAWFAPSIPIQDGPYVFHGLPGLIVSIGDATGDYLFSLQEIKKFKGSLYFRPKGLKMNLAKFQKLMMDYYKDPYASYKISNAPIVHATEDGRYVKMDFQKATKDVQKYIRDNNNPIELQYKNDYK